MLNVYACTQAIVQSLGDEAESARRSSTVRGPLSCLAPGNPTPPRNGLVNIYQSFFSIFRSPPCIVVSTSRCGFPQGDVSEETHVRFMGRTYFSLLSRDVVLFGGFLESLWERDMIHLAGSHAAQPLVSRSSPEISSVHVNARPESWVARAQHRFCNRKLTRGRHFRYGGDVERSCRGYLVLGSSEHRPQVAQRH